MELSEQEKRLINALRSINAANPAGAENFTTEAFLSHFTRMAEGIIPSAEEAYRRFLKESAGDRVVDLAYYRAPRSEDGKRIKKRG